MKKDIILVGASDTADRLISFIEHYDLYNVKGCAVNQRYIENGQDQVILAGAPRKLFPLEDIDNYRDTNTLFFVALFWNRLNADRREVFHKVKEQNLPIANIISPRASIRGDIGTGCYIADFAIMQEHSVLGDDVWLMDGAFIGHKSEVKAHAFCAVRSVIMGACEIGTQSFIGVSSTIFDEVKIGDKCLVGASTIVKRNLPPYSVIKTSNSDNIIKQYTEDTIENKWLAHHNVR